MPRIAINGFGRIGRNTFKAGWKKKGFNIVAINDLADAETLAYLLKHDSVHGSWNHKIKAQKGALVVDGKKIQIFSEKDPKQLPWKKMKVDLVIESTGVFRTEELAGQHITAGAGRVIISAPAKGGHAPTYMLGVNVDKLGKEKAGVINNASCTTNCIAPVARIMGDTFGVKKAMMTTIHGYTAGQNLVDGPRKDLRRGRAAAVNIVPTTTGAAIATSEAVPTLKNKFDGISIRVPVISGSLSDFTFLLKRKTTVEEVNATFKKMTAHPFYKGIVVVTNEPIVSTDILGNTASSIVDLSMTKVVGGDLVKVLVWYDNEWGYSNRLAEMAIRAA